MSGQSIKPSIVVHDITSKIREQLDIYEVKSYRGKNVKTLDSYQFRIKSKNLSKPLTTSDFSIIAESIKSFGASNVLINKITKHSSYYSSISFEYLNTDYECVIATKHNNGDKFEKVLIKEMQEYAAGNAESKIAYNAIVSLSTVDSSLTKSNIQSIDYRIGCVKRHTVSLEESGKVIGDAVITTKDNQKRYVSIKNISGYSIAQFGIAGAITPNFKINYSSPAWNSYLRPFNLNSQKVENGYYSAFSNINATWDTIEFVNQKVNEDSEVYSIFSKMWGLNYIYLKQTKTGFFAKNINKEVLHKEILNNLYISQIKYPCNTRKQITIDATTDFCKMQVLIRNVSGGGKIVPNIIQLMVLKLSEET